MARLLLVRHGDTALNSRERYWGQTDVALSQAGMAQAERLAERLAAEKITVAYASNLQRASVTAKTIAAKHGLEVVICPELSETNFGEIEGLTFDEVSARYPELTQQWLNWSLKMRFPGGESVDELKVRVCQFLERLEKHAPGDIVLVVAHSGVLRLLLTLLLGLELRHWRQFRLSLASLSIVETYPQGAILMLFNDVCHLAGD